MQTREICWNITARCNQKCGYCHRFLNIPELCFAKNKKILNNLIASGVTELTWTGGEPLLYKDTEKLMKIAHDNGIKNKLITNGSLLTAKRMGEVCGYIDSITLSIDSIDSKINFLIGRGKNYFKKIDYILTYLKKYESFVEIKVNTVINSYNIKAIRELNNYLSKFRINCWRIFMFMPLREMAIRNKSKFQISEDAFDKVKRYIIKESKVPNLEFRKAKDIESKYILILANGDMVVTNKKKDIKIGNALFDDINQWLGQ